MSEGRADVGHLTGASHELRGSNLATLSRVPPRAPGEVHATLGRYLLADGLEQVFDLEKSHGSWVHDARSGREYLDFMTFFASSPIGYNHPGMTDPTFPARLARHV